MNSLNVIGCGSVGRTLARLWQSNGVFELRGILNRSLASGERAVDFVGSGRAHQRYEQLGPADAVMISSADEAIRSCCQALCQAGCVGKDTVVFHCSGALPSTLLEPARQQGARVASLHPVKSFADPALAVETFEGTFCALEGDVEACDVLRDAVQRCGARAFDVHPETKTIYHAATVFACNYLVALIELALRCFDEVAVPRQTALQIIEPILHGTVENVLRFGPERALTGPIARGELTVVQNQLDALGACSEEIDRAYRALGPIALDLSAAKGDADPAALEKIRQALISRGLARGTTQPTDPPNI